MHIPRMVLLAFVVGWTACSSSSVDPPDCPAGGSCVSGDALASLEVSGGVLSPAFSATTSMYTLQLFAWTDEVRVAAVASGSAATIDVNGAPISMGAFATAVKVGPGVTMISVKVQSPGGAGQVYTIVATRAQSGATYLKASNTAAGDQFGYSISISGDTLAVGAQGEDSAATGMNGNQSDNSASGSGAVYVFRRSGATWVQEAYLKASNTQADDRFGWEVSLSGDTLAVGAQGEGSNARGINGDQTNNAAFSSGAVYVFRRNGTVWAQEAYLKASNTETFDNFGGALSLSGDTLAVGAVSESSSATGINGNQASNAASGSGAVYVFRRSGTTWTQEAYLKATNTGSGDGFGTSVSLSGDLLAVGAPGEASNATGVDGNQSDNSAGGSGAVYVYRRAGAVWVPESYIKASNAEAGDGFGTELSLSGDTLAVTANRESSNATGIDGNQRDNSASDSGALYVFRRNGTSWAQEAYLKASNSAAGDLFGYSVSLLGDVVAVGAIIEAGGSANVNGDQADNSLPSSGAVYVFRRRGTSWAQEGYLKAGNPDATDYFGATIAWSSDTLVVGAIVESSNATGLGGNQSDNSALASGAVYILQ